MPERKPCPVCGLLMKYERGAYPGVGVGPDGELVDTPAPWFAWCSRCYRDWRKVRVVDGELIRA